MPPMTGEVKPPAGHGRACLSAPMLSLHHTHLFASDVDRSIGFWRDHFGAVVLVDTVFAGARNVLRPRLPLPRRR